MSTSQFKHKFSNPAIQSKLSSLIFGDADKPCLLNMDLYINHAKVKFDNKIVNLVCNRDVFKFVHTDVVSLSEIKKCYEDDFSEEYIPDFISDFAYDLRDKIDLSELKITTDSNQPLYLEHYHNTYEYHQFDDKFFVRVEVYFRLNGALSNRLFENFDLSKFITRQYEHDEIETMLAEDKGVSDFDAFIPAVDEEFFYHDGRIDDFLLFNYIRHQFLSQVFHCTYDPFFEKDGLIHQKHRGFGEKEPEYVLPKQLIDLKGTIKNLKVGRRYHDTEWLFQRYTLS